MISPSGDTTIETTLHTQHATTAPVEQPYHPVRLAAARLVDYAILLKPRVMSLVLFTALVGLLLAPGTPRHRDSYHRCDLHRRRSRSIGRNQHVV